MKEKHRILVTYGCHLKEKYAESVGVRFRDLYLQEMFPDVIVARWRGVRGNNRLGQIRQDIGAKYVIDLHDDSTFPERAKRVWIKTHSPFPFEEWYKYHLGMAKKGEKYLLVAHMPYDEGLALLEPYTNKWNKEHGKESLVEGCECEYINPRRKGKPCELWIIGLEYCVFRGISREEGIKFLKKLVEYLRFEG